MFVPVFTHVDRADVLAALTAPVQTVRCTVNRRLAYVDPYQSITITFVNRADAPADEVRFTVAYAGRTVNLTDRGTFAKDTIVEHSYRALWNVPFAGATPQSCAITYAHFSNGTSW